MISSKLCTWILKKSLLKCTEEFWWNRAHCCRFHLTCHFKSHLLLVSSQSSALPPLLMHLAYSGRQTLPHNLHMPQQLVHSLTPDHLTGVYFCTKIKPFKQHFVHSASRISGNDWCLASMLPKAHSWLPTSLWGPQLLAWGERSNGATPRRGAGCSPCIISSTLSVLAGVI